MLIAWHLQKNWMPSLFQATSKPRVENLRDQMVLACAHITDHSPVWQMLKEMQLRWYFAVLYNRVLFWLLYFFITAGVSVISF